MPPSDASVNANRDALIAREINPKQRGWAWIERGLASDLTEPRNYHAMVAWAKEQGWWNHLAVPPWSTKPGNTWANVFAYLNKHLFDESLRSAVRDMIQRAIAESRNSTPKTSSDEVELVMPKP